MNSIISALVGSGATGLTGWVIMSARLRRKEKSDRFGDLRLDVNRQFADYRKETNRQFDKSREDMNRQFDEQRKQMNWRFDEQREDMNRQFDEQRKEMNRRFEEQRADSERRFTAILDEIKGLELRLTERFTGELKAQGERIDRVHDVLRSHGERLARMEQRLDGGPTAEAA